MISSIDVYFNDAKKWGDELQILRTIILNCGLREEFKWGNPCYTFQENNIVLIHAFKEYCAVLFFKGVLLNDANNLLIQQTENVQSARQIRFTNAKEIAEVAPVLKAYIYEAIEVEKAGLKVTLKTTTEFEVTIELQNEFDKDPNFKTAFEALTPGRQRGYKLFFSAPKQSKTREARVTTHIQQILNGKGLNDCTCGLSKKMPACDGSHKYLVKK